MIAFLASHESDFYEQWAEEAVDEVLRIDSAATATVKAPILRTSFWHSSSWSTAPICSAIEGTGLPKASHLRSMTASHICSRSVFPVTTLNGLRRSIKLRIKANRFLRKMRKELEFWKSCPLIRIATPGWCLIDHLPIAAELRKLPLLARLHLVAFVHSWRSPKHNRTSLMRYSGVTGTMVCLGMNTWYTAPLLVASGLCTPNYDPMVPIDVLSREELVAVLDQRGIAYGKSWGKTKMIEVLADALPDLLHEAAKREMVVSISDSHLAELRSFAAHAEASADYFKLLCFIDPDKPAKRIKRRYHIW